MPQLPNLPSLTTFVLLLSLPPWLHTSLIVPPPALQAIQARVNFGNLKVLGLIAMSVRFESLPLHLLTSLSELYINHEGPISRIEDTIRGGASTGQTVLPSLTVFHLHRPPINGSLFELEPIGTETFFLSLARCLGKLDQIGSQTDIYQVHRRQELSGSWVADIEKWSRPDRPRWCQLFDYLPFNYQYHDTLWR